MFSGQILMFIVKKKKQKSALFQILLVFKEDRKTIILKRLFRKIKVI